jgi:hypothetical protein
MDASSQRSQSHSAAPAWCGEMASPVIVTKSGPGLADLKKALERIRNSDVLVGIPAQKTQRKSDAVNNASLLFLLSKGSALNNQPPRPILEPAIEANKQIITPHLEAAARAVLEENPQGAERELKMAGTIASNAAKLRFSKEFLAPNAPSTIRRKSKKGKVSDTPGVDSGQLRRAVTYVVRENGQESVGES